MQKNDLKELTIRTSKENTSFIYFTLEANENLCFYSTLDYEKGAPLRDIQINCHPSTYPQLKSVLQHLQQNYQFDFI